jgi:hypothetical protein
MNPYESPADCGDAKQFDWSEKWFPVVMVLAMVLMLPSIPWCAWDAVTKQGQSVFDAALFMAACGSMAVAGIGIGCWAILYLEVPKK